MDLYSLEKTKDYTFFRVVYYYYQLTPRTIRILKIFFFMMLFSLFFVILHFSNDSENICFFIYINISIELIIVLYLLELLIINLAKGTEDERMIQMCNTLRECNDSFLNKGFKILKFYIFICIIIYGILNLIFRPHYSYILKKLVNNNLLCLYSFLALITGSIVQYELYYFNFWIGVIATTRATHHSITNYNDYIKFTYKISLIISIVTLYLHIIVIGIFFILMYFLFFISDPDYYSYPYDKFYIFLAPYILGIILINLLMSLSGVSYSQSSKKCFEYVKNIDVSSITEINLGYHYKNPIYLSSLISENILNVQKSMNSCLQTLINFLILIICSSNINNKTTLLKKSLFLFPLVYITLVGIFEIIKLCCVRTRNGLPLKGSIEYQEPETIVEIYSKGNWITGFLLFLMFIFLSFSFFSDFNLVNLFQSNNLNNNNHSNNNLEYINELFNINNNKQKKSHYKNSLWIYSCIIYLIGAVIFYFWKYFAKKFTEPTSPSLKNILNLSGGGGISFNLFGSMIIGIESSIFPLLLIFIIILNPFIFNLPYINCSIKNELGYYLQGILLLKMNSYSFYINIINESKNIICLTNSILKMTFIGNDQIRFISQKVYEDITTHQQNVLQVNHGISFFTFYLLIQNLKFLFFIDKNNKDTNNSNIKIDLNNPEILISGIIGLFFLKFILGFIINNVFITTELSTNKLKTLYSTPIQKDNLVERTKIDYQQCAGLITQISITHSYKIIIIITIFPFLLNLVFYILNKFIFNYKINDNNTSVYCLFSFLYFLICFGVINNYFSSNTSYSLINTHRLAISSGVSCESKDNLSKISKLGASIGFFLKDTIEISISIIIFYIFIIVINEMHIIL